MSENSKQNDIVTEILDAAFDKEWDVYSPEEYKHQLAETQDEVKKLTPEQEKTKMNKRMNLRVQATAIYRKDRHGSEATRKRYFQAFCYACDYLADTCNLQKVSNITPTHFRKVAEYWKSYKAPSTIQTELSGFRKYCKYAGCKHKMPENRELNLPKREPKKYNRGWLLTEYQKARELAEFMNRFDVRDGLDLEWNLGLRTPIYLFILFAGLMGMRKGEIIGLKYSDIDYAKQTITVQRQLGEEIVVDPKTGEHKILKKQEITPKTKSSTRILDIPDMVFNAIIEERKKYEANRRRRSTTFQDLDFIVCSSYGRPRGSEYVSPHYKKLLRENGLPDIRFHDLRHTFATLLLKKDIDLKAISNALGHSKSIISMDVYGDNQQIIADGVEEIVPFIREIMPEDVLAYLEEGQEKQSENFETDICFPNELADDIMQDVLNNRVFCGKDN